MLFDSTVRKELARSFGVTLVVIATVVLTMMLLSVLRQAAGGNVAPQDVLLLMGYASLAYLPYVLALSLFVAIVATLGRMYRESEMAIWFASGLPLRRFLRPVFQMAWPVLLAVLVLELVVWPWSNQNSAQLRERYEKRGDLSRVAPGQFQTSRDGSRVFFIDRDTGGGNNPAEGRNVFILSQTGEREAVTTAARGHVEIEGDDRFLVLEHGQRNESNAQTGDKSVARFQRYALLTDNPGLSSADQLPPKAMATLDLLREPTPAKLGELAWRLGLVLGAVNMTVLGLSLAYTNPRRPNNWNLMFALLSFFIYFNLISLSQSWVANGRRDFASALVELHGGALLLATAMLWWRDAGARSARRSHAKAVAA